MIIYHIVLPQIWSGFEDRDFYEAQSLDTEGFIHCSFEDQLEEVLKRYYSDAGEVYILEIESDKLTSNVVNEPSTNEELYPHIYGKIDREAIVGIEKRRLDSPN